MFGIRCSYHELLATARPITLSEVRVNTMTMVQLETGLYPAVSAERTGHGSFTMLIIDKRLQATRYSGLIYRKKGDGDEEVRGPERENGG